MHVYLTNGSQRKWLIVQLDEGHAPRIAGFPIENTEVSSTLEPAIWFKLMVLDSVSIDCEKHVVCWTTIADENENSQGREHLMFTDEDQFCYDFDDDLDELFNLAIYLINTNPMAELNKERRNDLVKEYQRSLFRLLHCYILAKVELHPEDTRQVLEAHKMQLRSISLVDEQVMLHRRIAEQYINQMRDIRENEILPNYQDLMSENMCNDEVVQMIVHQVCHDLEKAKDELNFLQDKVIQMKSKVQSNQISGDSNKMALENLAMARSKRDVAGNRLAQLLQWRETVLNYEDSTGRGPQQQQALAAPFVRYLQLAEKVKKEAELTTESCHKKVRAASVRECIESTLNDLGKGENSVGEEMTVDGKKPTNVITEDGCNTEYQTLNERLTTIVHNPEHPVGKEFLRFAGEIRQRCAEILRAYERLSEKSAVVEIDGYLIVDREKCPFDADILSDVSRRIRCHFEQLTWLLVEIFEKKNSLLFWRKLWLSYEKLFFHYVGDCLVHLYRLVNSGAVVDLEKRVARLRNFPVCKLGLQMKDEWWLTLFEPTPADAVDSGVRRMRDIRGSNSSKCASYSGLNHSESSNDSGCEEVRQFHRPENVGLMREKLQAGAAKVLSRSWSSYEVDRGGCFGFDPVRDGSLAMQQDISSKVHESRNLVAYSRLFSTEESRSEDLINDNMKNFARSCSRTGKSKRMSKSCSDILSCEDHRMSFEDHVSKRATLGQSRRDTFEKHFGNVLSGFREVFSVPSPLQKMQCLSASLRILARNVMELRQSKYVGSDAASQHDAAMSSAVTAEDLLPLIVLMLLKLKPVEVGKLFVEMCFISDMMADFLSSGCHSYALTEFQMGIRVLSQTCDELDIIAD
eukprot:gene5321-5990_t